MIVIKIAIISYCCLSANKQKMSNSFQENINSHNKTVIVIPSTQLNSIQQQNIGKVVIKPVIQ